MCHMQGRYAPTRPSARTHKLARVQTRTSLCAVVPVAHWRAAVRTRRDEPCTHKAALAIDELDDRALRLKRAQKLRQRLWHGRAKREWLFLGPVTRAPRQRDVAKHGARHWLLVTPFKAVLATHGAQVPGDSEACQQQHKYADKRCGRSPLPRQ
jgi:hypothetical protein